jgi:hypothetical protein
MLETQEDVDIDGMERCKGLCKYTFRQDSGYFVDIDGMKWRDAKVEFSYFVSLHYFFI